MKNQSNGVIAFAFILAFLLLPLRLSAENEPNNNRENANIMSPNGSVTGSLSSKDEDWYVITLHDDGELTLNFKSNGTLRCNDLKIFDYETGTVLATGTWGNVATVKRSDLGKNKYYVIVEYWDGGSGDYTLNSTFTPSRLVSDIEPNDEIDLSTLISINSTITGRLNYLSSQPGKTTKKDDRDWYKIVLNESGKIKVDGIADSPLRFDYLKIYDSNKSTVLASGSWGQTAVVSKDNILPGTYYIYVPAWDGYGSYNLTVTFSEANLKDDNEPNNQQSQAQLISLSDTVYARMGYQNAGVTDNTDWYKVSIPENGKLLIKFICENTLKINNPKLTIEDEFLRNSSTSWGNNFTFQTNDLSKGEYWLKLPRYEGYGAYKFIAEFTPFRYSDDIEPNNNFKNAVLINPTETKTGQLGYYRKTTDKDIGDWYEFNLTENGKVVFDILTDSVLQINNPKIYSTNDSTITLRSSSDSWRYNFKFQTSDLKKGKYYLFLPVYSNYGAYKLTYNFIQNEKPEDVEPNNDFKASVLLESGKKVTGHLGYKYSNTETNDNLDWYKIVVPANGSVKFSFLTDSFLQINNAKLYTVSGDVLSHRNTSNSWRYNFNFKVDNLSAGVYYLSVERWSEFGWYEFDYNFIPDAYADDKEANDKPSGAINYIPGDSVTGHLGYFYNNGGKVDASDYYKIRLPRPGIVTFKVDVNKSLVHELYLYGPDSTTRIQSHTAGYDSTRTMKVINLKAETDYFFKVSRYDGFGHYIFTTDYLPVPTAKLNAIQNLTTIYLNNESLNATSAIWDFGDGNVSTKMHPTHSYLSPGYYKIKLIVKNEAGEDSTFGFASVRGIQSIVTDRGGNGGKVTAKVNAGGLKEGLQVKLRKGNKTIEATGERLVTPGDVEVRFDLYQAELGRWDVVVQNVGETEMVLPEAFLVEEAVLPDVWADVQGRDKALFGRWQTYTVSFGNRGNVDALSRIIWIVTPDGDSVDVDFQNVNFDFPKPFAQNVYNDLKKDVPYYFKYDTINGEVRKVRVYGLMLSEIPANSEMSVKVRVKSWEDFEVMVFQTESFVDVDYNNPSQVPMIRSAEEYSSYESCVRWAIGQYLAGKVVETIAKQIPGAECLVSVVKTTSSLSTEYGSGELSLTSFAWTMSSTVWTCAKEFPGPWKAYETACDIADLVMDIKGVFDDSVEGYQADQECQKYKKKKEKKRKVKAVSSFDPNEMIGPKGFGKNNAVAKMVFPYTILFENKKTASAPAQEVVINDTLDITKFNTKTFKFTGFGFGGKNFTVVQDSNRFVQEVDLRPEKNALLRVSGVLDEVKGIARWHFITLDPETMDLTEDPDAGFLPPNVTAPEGDGFVSYVVDLNESIMDGDTLENRAEIIFDLNKPIMTNNYINVIDERVPESKVVSAKVTENPGEIELEIEGNDKNGSGIRYYDLYVSVNDSAFIPSLNSITTGKFRIKAPMGKNYRFFAIATDSLDLKEEIKTTADAMLYLPVGLGKVEADKTLTIYPNPVADNAIIGYELKEAGFTELTIINPAGQVIKTIERGFKNVGNHTVSIQKSGMLPGVYFLRLTSGDMVKVIRFSISSGF